MKKLRLTLITLVILSSIEGYSQDHANSTVHVIANPGVDQISANNQSISSTDSANLAAIAKLPLDRIHFQNKGARQHADARWEDHLIQNDSLIKIWNAPATDNDNLATEAKPKPSSGYLEMVEDKRKKLDSNPVVNKKETDDLGNHHSSN